MNAHSDADSLPQRHPPDVCLLFIQHRFLVKSPLYGMLMRWTRGGIRLRSHSCSLHFKIACLFAAGTPEQKLRLKDVGVGGGGWWWVSGGVGVVSRQPAAS